MAGGGQRHGRRLGRGRREEGERGRPGAGDLDEGGRAAVDVAGLPDVQAADEVGVGGPGPLLAGGALIPPGVPDQLVRGLQHPPLPGQLGQRLRVRGVHDEDAAVGGGRDPVPLILGRAQALPGLRGDLDADAQRPAPLVQVGQRHPAGDRGVVIGGEQHGAGLAVRVGGGVGGQLGQRHGLGFGDRRFAGAFQDEVPGVGVGQGAGAVQGGAEPVQQGGEPELDVGQVPGGGVDPGCLGGVAAVGPGARQPLGIEPVQERGGVRRRPARGGDGQGEDGLHDVGVVGGRAGAGLDHLVQQHGQVPGRQVPQGQAGLIGPDRDPAGARAVEQAAGPVCLAAGVPAALAVQHDQQRPRSRARPGRRPGWR